MPTQLNLEEAARTFMRECDQDPPSEIILDGKLRRYYIPGDRKGSKNGWYQGYSDEHPVLVFGDWKIGTSHKFRPGNNGRPATKEQREAWEKKAAEREAERRAEEEKTALLANKIFTESHEATPEHPYLKKKNIQPHGVRQIIRAQLGEVAPDLEIYGSGDLLALPLRDAEGKLWSIQFITDNGDKVFLEGGRVAGLFFHVGELGETIVICEGFSTGASIHESTGHGVVIAMNAGNLPKVAKAIHERHPDSEFVIAADNDTPARKTGIQAGQKFATEAARTIGAAFALPPKEGSDFNDLFIESGSEAVRSIIEQATKITITEEKSPNAQTDDQVHLVAEGKNLEPDEILQRIQEKTLADDEALAELSALSPLDFDRIAKKAADGLGCQLSTLREEVKKRRPSRKTEEAEGSATKQGRALELPEPEPWPEPVDGAALLDDLTVAFLRYLALPDDAAEAMALWAVFSHALDAFQIAPRLALLSPVKRCGKSTALAVLSRLVPRSLPAANISPAAVYRSVEAAQPTLLIDEADTFLNENNGLRGIINSSHYRPLAFVVRTEGDDHEPRKFSTWAPMVIAKIGKLTDTLQDRSIEIPMRRRKRDEPIERFRMDRANGLDDLSRKISRWTSDRLEALAASDPQIPDAVAANDRAADNWRPLLSVADTAGGKWPERAREAAVKLSGEEASGDESDRTLLLGDLRDLFKDKGIDRLPSADICEALAGMEERPWPEWGKKNDKPITTRQLASLLKPFEISPGTIWLGTGTTLKGYHQKDFEDVFTRYLQPPQTGP